MKWKQWTSDQKEKEHPDYFNQKVKKKLILGLDQYFMVADLIQQSLAEWIKDLRMRLWINPVKMSCHYISLKTLSNWNKQTKSSHISP